VSRGVVYSYVANRELVVRCLGGAFTGDEATPRFMAFMNDRRSVFLVLGLAGESELVLGLAVGDLVNAEPLVCSAYEAR